MAFPRVDLLVWVVATSRASVLSGYVEAAVTAMGTDPADNAESVAARFLSWLSETSRPWLVVLDDLSDEADLEGLWPDGAGGPGPDYHEGFRGSVREAPRAGPSRSGVSPRARP